MLLSNFIEKSLDRTHTVFTDDDLALEVLSLMQKKQLFCAPVLHEGKITAVITLLNLLSVKQSKKITGVRLKDLKLEQAESIRLHEHFFHIFPRIHSLPYTLIPVSDKEGNYVGVIEKTILLEHIATIFHLGEEGVTLELEVPSFDLKLSEVIATLEKNDATVLSFGIYPTASEGNSMVIVFRLQTHDLFRLVKNIEKYGYLIRYTSPFFMEKDDEMREKALEFIRFIDM